MSRSCCRHSLTSLKWSEFHFLHSMCVYSVLKIVVVLMNQHELCLLTKFSLTEGKNIQLTHGLYSEQALKLEMSIVVAAVFPSQRSIHVRSAGRGQCLRLLQSRATINSSNLFLSQWRSPRIERPCVLQHALCWLPEREAYRFH